MSPFVHPQVKSASAPLPSFTPARTGLLQRKCACGGTLGLEGECEECRKKRMTLQRRAVDQTEPTEVPPIVHEVLRSPGQPLDPATRAFFEPRFGHDFSKVRVHTDARAAESARAVNALAYTVGRDVVFGEEQYSPRVRAGNELIAHELTHVLQQGNSTRSQQKLELGARNDSFEQEAARLAEHILSTARCAPQGLTSVATRSLISPLSGRMQNGIVVQRTCAEHRDETFYQTAENYCKDTPGTSQLHPGQTCYREVPARSGYFDCPPGDQVCFDKEGRCHDSWDRASPVESKDPDGTCNLHGWCSLVHAKKDKVIQTWWKQLWESGASHGQCEPKYLGMGAYLGADCIIRQGAGPKL